jgi:hypothetical protein
MPVDPMGNEIPSEDPSRVVQDLLTFQWGRLGMRLKMYDYIKDSLMFSKGYAKTSWKFQTRTKTIMEPVVGKGDKITFKEVKKSEASYDDPEVEIVDPTDIYVDPDATSLENAKYLVHRKTVAKEVLKENPNYKNIEKIKENSSADRWLDKPNDSDIRPPEDKHESLVEILEYWEPDRLIVVANRSVVLRDSPNPYHHKMIPFVELDDYRDPHNYYGQSELSVIDPLQREINSIRNQRRDYDNIALNPVILHVPGTLRNPNAAVMRPGALWSVSDLNSIDVLTLPQLQGSSTEIEAMTADDIKRTVAIDEIAIGLLPGNPQRRSATEVATSQNSAGQRFGMKIALLEEAVKKIGQQIFALNQQFLSKERMIQIVGEDGAAQWVELTPEDIRGDFTISIETGSMLPKDEVGQRQEAIELLQYITPIVGPIIQSSPRVALPVIKMVMSTFDLPQKNEIMDELEKALQEAGTVTDEQNVQAAAGAELELLNGLLPPRA